MFDMLISSERLAAHRADPAWVVLDCRFALADPDQGERDYRGGHIPGARYAHLERNLSGPIVPGVTGRHPLPDPARLARRLGDWGIDAATQVVAYDASGGAIAARTWWLLRWLGHDAVAVLDGGLAAWLADGRSLATDGPARREPRTFVARPRWDLVADAEAVAAEAGSGGRVLDARGADRFRGENESIDAVAGHIPGARSMPFADNLASDGRFLPPDALRRRYAEVLGEASDRAPDAGGTPIVYCGSGVTAAHDVLAMRIAGLPEPRLYAGSWSHWITDPSRPVATGAG